MTIPLLRLAQKVVSNPRRALLRLVLLGRLARTALRKERARALEAIAALWDVDAPALAEEYRRSEVARWYRERLKQLGATMAKARMGTSDGFACEILYLLVRALRPEVVVETGVLYGASSGHILAALDANGSGQLYSIDLGTPPGEPPHDYLVHPELRRRWNYIEGDVRGVLPPLLAELGQIDLFYHDSLHTFDHMTWEYQTAGRWLRPDGVLASHDVRVADGLLGIFRENAFPAFCRHNGLRGVMARNSGFVVWQRPYAGSALEHMGCAPGATTSTPMGWPVWSKSA
jgi:predicted O-methyltransferase YrrM